MHLLQANPRAEYAGTVGLVAAPIAGAVQSGVKGFALGCAAGKPVPLYHTLTLLTAKVVSYCNSLLRSLKQFAWLL